jgi:hypothetical protein
MGWESEVRALYERSWDMEVAEFEALLTTAMRGEQPKHPDLPMFLPFATESLPA